MKPLLLSSSSWMYTCNWSHYELGDAPNECTDDVFEWTIGVEALHESARGIYIRGEKNLEFKLKKILFGFKQSPRM